MEIVQDISITDHTNSTISLKWAYSKNADGFNITITPIEDRYPNFPVWTTKKSFVTVTNLAPGATYSIKVFAFRKSFSGPEALIIARTSETPLPEVSITTAELVKDIAPTVKLIWDRPKGPLKVTWVYGVYFGANVSELRNGYKFNTTNLTATIPNLYACEKYYFSVGIVGPVGIGKMSVFKTVNTQFNELAPPKGLYVQRDTTEDAKMWVHWEPSCSFVKTNSEYEVSS